MGIRRGYPSNPALGASAVDSPTPPPLPGRSSAAVSPSRAGEAVTSDGRVLRDDVVLPVERGHAGCPYWPLGGDHLAWRCYRLTCTG